MSQPIIVGFDGSEHGRDALALGRALAQALSTQLIVVIAYAPEERLWVPWTAEPLDARGQQRLVEQAEAGLSSFDRAECRTVASESAAGALQAEAEGEHAQVIVVGSTHRGAAGRILLGTVTQEVLDAAPCAVAVAPVGLASVQPISFSIVGVGFDDTDTAHDALAVARSLARRAGSELRVIWAAHLVARALPSAFMSYLGPDYFDHVRAEVEDRLNQATAPIRAEMVVETKIVGGDTIAALVEQSAKMDLLVLGSRGYGPVKRVLLGSVSRRLVNGARCPVLIVPPGGGVLEDDARAQQSAGRAESDALATTTSRRSPSQSAPSHST